MIATLYYVPVTSKLKEIAQRLGDYLHAGKKYHAPEDRYWVVFRELLTEGSRLLEETTRGTLLGPVLINKKTGEALMPTELLPGDRPESHPLLEWKGKALQVEVSYHRSLATAEEQS